VTFDRESIEARLAWNRIGSSDMPKIAWDALEAGMDGPGIRRLAALDSPTYFEVRDVLPGAMQEMGIVELSRGVAALRLAKNCAKQILQRREDPLKHTRDFEGLSIDADYSRELAPVGALDDEVFIARTIWCQPDDQIRE